MENTLKLIEKFFEENDLKYETKVLESSKIKIFKFGIDTQSIIGNLKIFVYLLENEFLTQTVINNKVEKDKLPAVAEYLHRANYKLKNGNFEMDYSDGEIRYRTYVSFENTKLSYEIIESSILMPIAIIKHYGKGLIQTMLTGEVADMKFDEDADEEKADK